MSALQQLKRYGLPVALLCRLSGGLGVLALRQRGRATMLVALMYPYCGGATEVLPQRRCRKGSAVMGPQRQGCHPLFILVVVDIILV